MSEPFIGEIRMVGFNYAPRNWAFCDWQLVQISQNNVLYSILGTTYGGDGTQTFALPDLRGRVPIHKGPGYNLGQKLGQQAVVLNENHLPKHTHQVAASSELATVNSPSNNLLAHPTAAIYNDPSNLVQRNQGAINSAGGAQAHYNMQPYLAVRFCIALQGMYPSRN